jgi:hypothetical protein
MRATREKTKMAASSDRKNRRAPAKKKLPTEPWRKEKRSEEWRRTSVWKWTRKAAMRACEGREKAASEQKGGAQRGERPPLFTFSLPFQHHFLTSDGVLVRLADPTPQRVVALHDLRPLGLRGLAAVRGQAVGEQAADGDRLLIPIVRQAQAAGADVPHRRPAQDAHDLGRRPAVVRYGQDVGHVRGQAAQAGRDRVDGRAAGEDGQAGWGVAR